MSNLPITHDLPIRAELKRKLYKDYVDERNAKIIEELGVQHGTTRIDIAVINGFMHGYEIKSDADTLERLPKQVKEFSRIFDKLTLVVGKRHLYQAIYNIPDWWGLIIAKRKEGKEINFQTIRVPEQNKNQDGISIARLLWKEEALRILEKQKKANGLRYKPREVIYQKLAEVFSSNKAVLKSNVSSILISRKNWRVDAPLIPSGD